MRLHSMHESALESRNVEIRRWADSDDIQAITELLHRAYARLDDLGFRYHATWQDSNTTLHRLKKGVPFVATQCQKIIGTITLYVPPNVRGREGMRMVRPW